MATKEQQYTGRLYTQAEVDRLVREAKLAIVVDLEAKVSDGEWLSTWIRNQYAALEPELSKEDV